MIKVTVEVWPFGSEEDKKTVYSIEVANVYTAVDIANYACRVKSPKKEDAYFAVTDHKRSDGMARLLEKVFQKMAEGNNGLV